MIFQEEIIAIFLNCHKLKTAIIKIMIMHLPSIDINSSPQKNFFPSVEVTLSSVEKITLSPVEIISFSFHVITFIILAFSIKKSFDWDKRIREVFERISKFKPNEVEEQVAGLNQNVDWLLSKVRELLSDSTTTETAQSKSLAEVRNDFDTLIEKRIPTVTENVISNLEKQNLDSLSENRQQLILKIRAEIAKKLFPNYRISNIDSLIVNIVYELSKYVSGLLSCNTSDLSQYHLIPEQIEELARISVEIQHDAKCANSSSDFWREVKGTTYDLSRHKAVNYNPEVYKALGRENQNITSYDSKPYAKIAFTIAPGYSIFDHLHKKERVLVPALVYLDETVEI